MDNQNSPVVMQKDIETKKQEIKEYLECLKTLCTPNEKRILKSINT